MPSTLSVENGEEISKKLHDFIRKSGLTHKQIGQRVGATAETVTLWEKGKRSPFGDRRARLLDLMANYKICRSNEAIRVSTAKCRKTNCEYYCDSTYTCDYFIITGNRRPCEPGNKCTMPNRRKSNAE